MAKSIVEFKTNNSIWEIVDEWAYKNEYALCKATPNGDMRQYTKGILAGVVLVDISQKGENAKIEACMSAALGGSEVPLTSKSWSLPQRKGFQQVNLLLESLGQPILK